MYLAEKKTEAGRIFSGYPHPLPSCADQRNRPPMPPNGGRGYIYYIYIKIKSRGKQAHKIQKRSTEGSLIESCLTVS